MTAPPPCVTDHLGIRVVRDDLFPGGTKARFAARLFDGADEVVYASPAEGGAQTALAITAERLGKRATIFVAKRAKPHARALMAKAHGAKVYQVSPGYLNVVQARARAYCASTSGAHLAPFGFDLPWAIDAIAEAALATSETPEEVWCAGGSGTLARGLALAWPHARLNVVQEGESCQSRAPRCTNTGCRLARWQGHRHHSLPTRITTRRHLRFALPGTGQARSCFGTFSGRPKNCEPRRKINLESERGHGSRRHNRAKPCGPA